MSEFKEFWITKNEQLVGKRYAVESPLDLATSEPIHVIEYAALEAKDKRIVELQEEVSKRNQYKINQEALDNVHKHYEDIQSKLDTAIAALEFYESKGKVTRDTKTEWDGCMFMIFDKFGGLCENTVCGGEIADEALASIRSDKSQGIKND